LVGIMHKLNSIDVKAFIIAADDSGLFRTIRVSPLSSAAKIFKE